LALAVRILGLEYGPYYGRNTIGSAEGEYLTWAPIGAADTAMNIVNIGWIVNLRREQQGRVVGQEDGDI
jgi:hypothetical protein